MAQLRDWFTNSSGEGAFSPFNSFRWLAEPDRRKGCSDWGYVSVRGRGQLPRLGRRSSSPRPRQAEPTDLHSAPQPSTVSRVETAHSSAQVFLVM